MPASPGGLHPRGCGQLTHIFLALYINNVGHHAQYRYRRPLGKGVPGTCLATIDNGAQGFRGHTAGGPVGSVLRTVLNLLQLQRLQRLQAHRHCHQAQYQSIQNCNGAAPGTKHLSSDPEQSDAINHYGQQ